MSIQGPEHVTYVATSDPVVTATVAPTATPGVVTGVPATAVRTATRRRFAPDAAITAAIGVAILVLGIIAAVRAGFDGPYDQPVVEVLGFTHTTTLGLIEAGIGACLLIAGATASRSAALFFGTVLGIAGFVGGVQSESFAKRLALESGLGWLMMVAGIVVVLATLLIPRTTRTTDRYDAAIR